MYVLIERFQHVCREIRAKQEPKHVQNTILTKLQGLSEKMKIFSQ